MSTERHHHVTIDRTNAEYWLAKMHSFADNARRHGDREGAARLDLVAEDLIACMAANWRDRRGIAVTHWDYHMWITPRPHGLLSVRMQLQPTYLAA